MDIEEFMLYGHKIDHFWTLKLIYADYVKVWDYTRRSAQIWWYNCIYDSSIDRGIADNVIDIIRNPL